MDPVPDLLVSRDGPVLHLTIDRPAALNALTDALTDGLAAHLEAAGCDDDLRVVVLSGTGGAFSSGADIGPGPPTGKGTGSQAADAVSRFDVTALDRANRLIRATVGCDKPVVAVVDGVAAGVGCSLALACDLVVATERARFLLAFARIGLMPDGGATALVTAAIGRARAMRMALLAEPLDGQAALEAGLVSHLVAAGDLQAAVADVVRRLAAAAPLGLAATKRAVNAAALAELDGALERERTGQTVLLRTADAAEGMRAFAQRRAPQFRGE